MVLGSMARILVVEDDFEVAQTLLAALKTESHEVSCADSAEDAEQLLSIADFDLLILDCGLPGRSGIDVCNTYRGKHSGEAAVLFVTGRSSLADKELGFNSGADDYMTKPFDVRELLLRVAALLRRTGARPKTAYTYKDLLVDPEQKLVKTSDSSEIKLAPREFSLLEFLIRSPGKYFTTAQLLASVWSSDLDAAEDSVRISVHRLRHALSKSGAGVEVQNLHGHGYRLN